MQTVLVDEMGFTIHEFGRVVSNQDVLDWVKQSESADFILLQIIHNDLSVPPETHIVRKYLPTGTQTYVGYIRQRE